MKYGFTSTTNLKTSIDIVMSVGYGFYFAPRPPPTHTSRLQELARLKMKVLFLFFLFLFFCCFFFFDIRVMEVWFKAVLWAGQDRAANSDLKRPQPVFILHHLFSRHTTLTQRTKKRPNDNLFIIRNYFHSFQQFDKTGTSCE